MKELTKKLIITCCLLIFLVLSLFVPIILNDSYFKIDTLAYLAWAIFVLALAAVIGFKFGIIRWYPFGIEAKKLLHRHDWEYSETLAKKIDMPISRSCSIIKARLKRKN